MEYYIVYDLKDNIVCYLDDIIELVDFIDVNVGMIKYRFKNRDYIVKYIDHVAYKIYKFEK